MSKAALSLAERLAQLRQIPQHLLPGTLRHKLLLPRLTELKLEANRSAKELGPVFAFYRKYVADLRHHNPHLLLTRQVTETGPLVARISLRKAQEGEPFVIEAGKCKTAEELRSRIQEYHDQ